MLAGSLPQLLPCSPQKLWTRDGSQPWNIEGPDVLVETYPHWKLARAGHESLARQRQSFFQGQEQSATGGTAWHEIAERTRSAI